LTFGRNRSSSPVGAPKRANRAVSEHCASLRRRSAVRTGALFSQHIERQTVGQPRPLVSSTPRLKLWLGRAFELAKGAARLAASTIAAKWRGLEREIDDILVSPADCPLARELIAKTARAREQLLTFLDYRGQIEPTNNDCERYVRQFVIARKVSNGFRSDWAAKHDAALRTAVDTARLVGARPFRTILETLAEI
jgi:hypothetical protein